VLYCIERLGSAGAMGDFARSARLLGAAQGMRDRLNLRRPLYSVPEWEQDLAVAREGLGDEAFEVAWAEGYSMSFDELVRYATQPADAELVGASVLSNPCRGERAPASDGSPGTDRAGGEQSD
jgi:hypothetical protein